MVSLTAWSPVQPGIGPLGVLHSQGIFPVLSCCFPTVEADVVTNDLQLLQYYLKPERHWEYSTGEGLRGSRLVSCSSMHPYLNLVISSRGTRQENAV